ncbi:MYO2 protein [Gonium pectorale]|uniref:MYO2 protein n=1 Tax=Gonium pectorale TaxID=33097 RepID=A0A150GMW0_GONPE|nr:MYO2 protein [Gonium pectorale]|eukprot:KXZ51147.1 MYO2 protein [Gonium pectorale]
MTLRVNTAVESSDAHLANTGTVEDMTTLAFLHEPGVLWNLQARYQEAQIYTYTGSILIAVNPFKSLPHLYGTDVIERYRSAPREQLPPHVYATACAAYRNMMRDGAGQAILVTGESGAGKTETAKLIMACLTHLGAHHSGIGSGGGMSGVEQKILESNPLLEAFGNAKTLRNNNSSRFGKYVEIFFDPAAATGFAYLARSSCFELPGQSNAEEYQHTRRAMSHIGLSEEQQSAVLATVAAVLHLGNITFVEGDHADRGSEGAAVASGSAQEALRTAAQLLGVEAAALAEVLTTRQIQTREGAISTPLSAQAAFDARDSLAKVVYARLFDWLVAAVNTAVDEAHNGDANGTGGAAAGRRHLSIGLLDIYGFESFEVNDLEQLCINLTNEKLQQHFNQHVFKWEQAEYEREGVDWSYISFRDNADVLELLEGRMGLMDLLDETCRFPKATADDLAHKYGSSPALSVSSRFARLKRPANSFSIEHYAGSVTYSTQNFLDKNRDYVVAEHSALLSRSSRPLMAELFTQEGPTGGIDAANGGGAAGGRQSQFQFRSVSSVCRRQLAELMGALAALQPHYVRCIKPNAAGEAGTFAAPYSLQQLRCGGVMEAVRIACAGYAYRRSYAAFLDHFWQLCPEPVHALRRRAAERSNLRQPKDTQPPQQGADGTAGSDLAVFDVDELRTVAEAVLAAAGLVAAPDPAVTLRRRAGAHGSSHESHQQQPPQHHLGHTKVFLRATAAADLERQRVAAANAAATCIQAHFRRMQVERWYMMVRCAVVVIQRMRCERAALTIQRAWRGCLERVRFLRMRRSAVVIQAMWRCLLTRRAYEVLRVERAALAMQTAWRGAVVRREYLGVLRYWRAAVKVQAAWRAYSARQLYLQILPLHRAALVIQRVWRSNRRGTQLAERLRSALVQYWVYTKAAVVIQAVWRGKVARHLYRKLRHQQRRARLLAAFGGAAAATGPGHQQQSWRQSPDLTRRADTHTPITRPCGRFVSGGGWSTGKQTVPLLSHFSQAGMASADGTPLSSHPQDVVRCDDVASLMDRDTRMRVRLADMQDFKMVAVVAATEAPARRQQGNERCDSRSLGDFSFLSGKVTLAPGVVLQLRNLETRNGRITIGYGIDFITVSTGATVILVNTTLFTFACLPLELVIPAIRNYARPAVSVQWQPDSGDLSLVVGAAAPAASGLTAGGVVGAYSRSVGASPPQQLLSFTNGSWCRETPAIARCYNSCIGLHEVVLPVALYTASNAVQAGGYMLLAVNTTVVCESPVSSTCGVQMGYEACVLARREFLYAADNTWALLEGGGGGGGALGGGALAGAVIGAKHDAIGGGVGGGSGTASGGANQAQRPAKDCASPAKRGADGGAEAARRPPQIAGLRLGPYAGAAGPADKAAGAGTRQTGMSSGTVQEAER